MSVASVEIGLNLGYSERPYNINIFYGDCLVDYRCIMPWEGGASKTLKFLLGVSPEKFKLDKLYVVSDLPENVFTEFVRINGKAFNLLAQECCLAPPAENIVNRGETEPSVSVDELAPFLASKGASVSGSVLRLTGLPQSAILSGSYYSGKRHYLPVSEILNAAFNFGNLRYDQEINAEFFDSEGSEPLKTVRFILKIARRPGASNCLYAA